MHYICLRLIRCQVTDYEKPQVLLGEYVIIKNNGGVYMSCHNVGHALNTVATGILHYYDIGEIPFEVAKNLLKIARDGVGFCDGAKR